MHYKQVIQAWINGEKGTSRPFTGYTRGYLSTDGESLYSYNVVIGERFKKSYIVWNYTPECCVNGKWYKGVQVDSAVRRENTSNHVGLALNVLEGTRKRLRILHPDDKSFISPLNASQQSFQNNNPMPEWFREVDLLFSDKGGAKIN